jgi:molybdopterin-guanine dinucleotide biosynthesis protein A
VKPDLSVLVLAGGDARRLGGRKADRQVGARRLVDCVLDVAHAVSDDVILLSRDRDLTAADTRRVPDESQLIGPLAGLAAGLGAAVHDWCLLLPCDMPHAHAGVVALLQAALAEAPDARAVTVHADGMPQPFHALYHRDVLEDVTTIGLSARPSMRALLARLGEQGRRQDIPVESLGSFADGRFLQDVDTPADLARLSTPTA